MNHLERLSTYKPIDLLLLNGDGLSIYSRIFCTIWEPQPLTKIAPNCLPAQISLVVSRLKTPRTNLNEGGGGLGVAVRHKHAFPSVFFDSVREKPSSANFAFAV